MTIMIKAAFYPLNAAAARSMGKMKIIAPKMKALQEQYANDKQQLQIKMMEMYKTEKINPLGGCLPILVQIPVFIALYWVLLSAVELRQAPWILWIKDLSAPDPYFVLPVIYAITAYLQVKLSPTPITDPVQAKVMQIMPIAFSVLFIFFPSGLVLYWLVNNILQIAQQWHMNRMLEKEAAAKAATKTLDPLAPGTSGGQPRCHNDSLRFACSRYSGRFGAGWMSPHHMCEQPERHAISSARVVPLSTQACSRLANASRTRAIGLRIRRAQRVVARAGKRFHGRDVRVVRRACAATRRATRRPRASPIRRAAGRPTWPWSASCAA